MFKCITKIAILVGLIVLPFSHDSQAAMPTLFEAPRFKLTSQDQVTFDSSELKGKIWVVDFLYTSCGHECPLMTAAKRRVDEATKSKQGVMFVSFTTDPKKDSASVLKKYGDKHKVDWKRWVFLTGDKKEIVKISKDGFKLPAFENKPTHSEKFALVDRDGKIRGYYESQDKKDIDKLISDLNSLN